MQESTKRKLLRSTCHASALASWSVISVGVPIVILFLSDDLLVRDSAKEALNFMISMIFLGLIAGAICFTVIGIPLAILMFIALAIASTILPIVAIASVVADPSRAYRYPFTIRLIKPTLKSVEAGSI